MIDSVVREQYNAWERERILAEEVEYLKDEVGSLLRGGAINVHHYYYYYYYYY